MSAATEVDWAAFTVTEPSVVHGMPDETYHADPIVGGSLSSTFARLLTNHVPAKALARRMNNKPSRAMDRGKAAHLHALGAGPRLIVWEHDGRTKDGKAERAAAAPLLATQEAVAVTPAEHDQVLAMAEALRADKEVRKILDTSQPEVSAFWQDGKVWCRARYDLLSDAAAYDYKTARDVTRRGFSLAMGSYGYHQQADFYERGLTALKHPAAGTPMRFICQETEPPYLVQIHTPDEMAREVARSLNDRAIRLYAECVKADKWPGYAALDAEPVSLPAFYYFDYEDVLPDEWRPINDNELVI